jgi:MerR family transcriptional regulator/heat shock protein HspR
MKKRVKTYTISAVAEMYDIHPQTLRLYEREGLLKPSRSDGNTRLYSDQDLEIILNMRQKMDEMQREFENFFNYLRSHAREFSGGAEDMPASEALIPVSRMNILKARRSTENGE